MNRYLPCLYVNFFELSIPIFEIMFFLFFSSKYRVLWPFCYVVEMEHLIQVPGPVELDALEGPGGGDGGGPGPVQHQGDLAEVVAWSQRTNLYKYFKHF